MAVKKQKSQAEKIAGRKNAAPKQSSASKKSTEKNPNREESPEKKGNPEKKGMPKRLISSIVFLSLFVLFLVIFITPSGALTGMISNFIHGMIGEQGFVMAIPALLCLFLIHAFSGKRPVALRTFCVISFVFAFSCICHLFMNPNDGSSLGSVGELYQGGIDGRMGGVLCGLLAKLLSWACGRPISYILLIIGGLFALLGSVGITIPGIVKAIQNRPRANWEDEEEKEKEHQDPAAVVVNHIAKKRIDYIEQKRNARAENEKKRRKPMTDEERASDIMRQIEGDTDDPVGIASSGSGESAGPEILIPQPATTKHVVPAKPATEKAEPIPANMPELEIEPEIEDVPFVEPVAKAAPPISAEPAPKVVKPVKVKVTAKDTEESALEVAAEISENQAHEQPKYNYPPIDLMKLPSGGAADGTAEMRDNSARLNEALASFKIEAQIINVTRGPSVTRYEVELQKGVRLNKLTAVADDIALSLGATGVRIAAIPGKISVVGIEVPNRSVTMVSLREVIDSPEFQKAKSKSSFAVGKDIGGNCIVGNIAKLPHMLIAGTTGSGKSVCMNSIIISLLYKASPEEVKLIMVDPKMVELGIYNGIPHLLIPVVTDPKKAAGSLQWAVTEMMRRYKAMSDVGVRDLESYNSIMDSESEEGKRLPQVVVIIDELADLMLVAAKEVEESICRIAQMGRAAGIHLVIATQRPSADVITGLMKANIPSRIAFSVASAMESRIILDTQGAEKLVGRGDMLYAPIGDGKPKRVQGCFVSDSEVEAVAVYVKSLYTTDYDQDVMEEIEKKAKQTDSKPSASDPEPNADELSGDEMLPAAVDVILETGQASVSMLQRRLKLGYARAARIVDEMEERGIVGPFQGSKPRDILVTKEQWEAMKSGQTNAQMEFDDLEPVVENPETDEI